MASRKVTNNSCKFEEGEKVLCYEPDPAKTKVLYDSKVKKLLSEKDDQGRKFYKYLIHFQGWNSTWDRYVTDEFILKDTGENRELQKKLADEAQLTPGGHLYRKERKRRPLRSNAKLLNSELSDDTADEGCAIVKDEIVEVPSDTILRPKRKLPEFKFCEDLKFHMGWGCLLVLDENYLVRLPCQPNVVTLLENYLKYSAASNFRFDKTPKKARLREVLDNKEIEKCYNISIETIDSLRILFDACFSDRLIINDRERAQYYVSRKIPLDPPVINTLSQNIVKSKYQDNLPNGEEVEDHHSQVGDDYAPSVITQSQRTCSDCSLNKRQCSKIVQDTFNKARNKFVADADKWKAVPDSQYNEDIIKPALIYGVYHLLRFMEVLPKILELTELNNEKLGFVYSFCNGLLSYISTQNDLFGRQCFVKFDTKEKESTETVKQKRNEELVKINKRIRKT